MNVCLIVNPHAGKKQGLQVAERVETMFGNAGISCTRFVSEHPRGTREIAETVDQGAWDAVVVVGGDGSLFEVINGLLATSDSISIPMGQIPMGTGNSFVRDLHRYADGFTPEDQVADAAQRIVAGATRPVDLGHFSSEAGDFYFINLLGAGFVSNVAYRAIKYKWLGSLSYILGVIEEVIRLKTTSTTLEIDGEIIERDGVFVEICNSRFTGGNMMMAPPAVIDDGLLDVVLLNRVPRGTVLKLLPSIFTGKHIEAEPVEVFRGRSIKLTTATPFMLTPDGETFGSTPIEVTIHPAKLEMFA